MLNQQLFIDLATYSVVVPNWLGEFSLGQEKINETERAWCVIGDWKRNDGMAVRFSITLDRLAKTDDPLKLIKTTTLWVMDQCPPLVGEPQPSVH